MIDDYVAEIGAHLAAGFEIAFAAIAVASAIAAVTPTPRDDEWAGKLYRIVDALALNVWRAKDKPQRGGRFVAE